MSEEVNLVEDKVTKEIIITLGSKAMLTLMLIAVRASIDLCISCAKSNLRLRSLIESETSRDQLAWLLKPI